jgi:hypothetical protein
MSFDIEEIFEEDENGQYKFSCYVLKEEGKPDKKFSRLATLYLEIKKRKHEHEENIFVYPKWKLNRTEQLINDGYFVLQKKQINNDEKSISEDELTNIVEIVSFARNEEKAILLASNKMKELMPTEPENLDSEDSSTATDTIMQPAIAPKSTVGKLKI